MCGALVRHLSGKRTKARRDCGSTYFSWPRLGTLESVPRVQPSVREIDYLTLLVVFGFLAFAEMYCPPTGYLPCRLHVPANCIPYLSFGDQLRPCRTALKAPRHR